MKIAVLGAGMVGRTIFAFVGIPNLFKIFKLLACFSESLPLLVCSAGKKLSAPTTFYLVGIKTKELF